MPIQQTPDSSTLCSRTAMIGHRVETRAVPDLKYWNICTVWSVAVLKHLTTILAGPLSTLQISPAFSINWVMADVVWGLQALSQHYKWCQKLDHLIIIYKTSFSKCNYYPFREHSQNGGLTLDTPIPTPCLIFSCSVNFSLLPLPEMSFPLPTLSAWPYSYQLWDNEDWWLHLSKPQFPHL